MIPADRFLIDGTEAWWVITAPIEFGDRPCETCDGEMWTPMLTDIGPNPELGRCSADCIDGRHTFDIEVEGRCGLTDCDEPYPRTYRVSIVPGMVLRITDRRYMSDHGPQVTINPVTGTTRLKGSALSGDDREITLPPAAAPGMWAVRLKVAA